MSTPGFFYTIAEIDAAVDHLREHGEHNEQADNDPELAALVQELNQARGQQKNPPEEEKS